MSLEAIFRSIESQKFLSYLSFANSAVIFDKLVDSQPVVRHLTDELKSNPEIERRVLSRVESLVREQDDVRYRNQRDAALAAYTRALNNSNPALGRLAASIVLDAPRLWWARKTALNILGGAMVAPPPAISSTTVILSTLATDAPPVSASTLQELEKNSLVIMRPLSTPARQDFVLDSRELSTNAEDTQTMSIDVGGANTTNQDTVTGKVQHD